MSCRRVLFWFFKSLRKHIRTILPGHFQPRGIGNDSQIDIAGKTRLLELRETAHVPRIGHSLCDSGIGIGFPETEFDGIVLLNDQILGDQRLYVCWQVIKRRIKYCQTRKNL